MYNKDSVMSEMFLKNTWYMVGFSHELQAGMLARKIVDIAIVMFRDSEGIAQALQDRCPHRFAPLSKGVLTEHGVQCGYHGLTFAGDGSCSGSLLEPKVPKACRVRSFPLAERKGLLWLWAGDPALADEALIVDTSVIDPQRLRIVSGLLPVKANYLMLSDNLLDLTHATFLPPDFGGDLYRPEHRVHFEGNEVHSNYLVRDVPNPEKSDGLMSTNGLNVDMWDDAHWFSPGVVVLDSGNVATGRPREEGLAIPAVHCFTPETEHTTHYFWISGLDNDCPGNDQDLADLLGKAFVEEDAPMIEAAYAQMSSSALFDHNPVLLRFDSAAVRARRIVQQLLDAEAQAVSISSSPVCAGH